MSRVPIALKRLTRNDVSWLEPKAKSHQCAINLPTGAFTEMFEDVQRQEGNTPRREFMVHWYMSDGTKLTNKGSEIVYYHSKSEFRLLNVPREKARDIMKENHLLFFRREGGNLHVTHLGPGGTHLVSEFGHSKLVQKLPRQSKKLQDQEQS